MNNYKITFTAYPIVDGHVSSARHFSGCKATIMGETFETAVLDFKTTELQKGTLVGFVIEGDFAKVEFFDITK